MFVVHDQCQCCYDDGAQHGSVGGVRGRTSGCRERESRRELVCHLEMECMYNYNIACTLCIIIILL